MPPKSLISHPHRAWPGLGTAPLQRGPGAPAEPTPTLAATSQHLVSKQEQYEARKSEWRGFALPPPISAHPHRVRGAAQSRYRGPQVAGAGRPRPRVRATQGSPTPGSARWHRVGCAAAALGCCRFRGDHDCPGASPSSSGLLWNPGTSSQGSGGRWQLEPASDSS